MANITKIGAVVLVIVMAAAALSFGSSGDSGNGSLDQITVGDNGLKSPHDGCTWDGDSKTLIIDSVTANRITFSFVNNVSATLMVKGDCKILNNPSVTQNIIGIDSNVSLAIAGTGSLYVEGYISDSYLINETNSGDLVIDGLKLLTVDMSIINPGANFSAGAISWSIGDIVIKNCEKIELTCRNGIINAHMNNDSETYDIHIENSFIVFHTLKWSDLILIGSVVGKIYCEEPSGGVYCTDEWMSEEPVSFESGKISCIRAFESETTITFGHYENGSSNSALVVFLIIIALVMVAVLGIYFSAKNAKN